MFKPFSRLLGLVGEILDPSSTLRDFGLEKVELGQTNIMVGSQKL